MKDGKERQIIGEMEAECERRGSEEAEENSGRSFGRAEDTNASVPVAVSRVVPARALTCDL